MVKSYFRYSPRWIFGTANPNPSNQLKYPNKEALFLPAGEFVQIINTKTGEIEENISFPKKTEFVSQISIGFSPTGNMLAIGYADGDVGLFYLNELNPEEIEERGSRSLILSESTSTITALSFSSQGDLLAVGSKGSAVVLWDTISHTSKAKFLGHSASISCVTLIKISEVDFVISGSLDGCIRVFFFFYLRFGMFL